MDNNFFYFSRAERTGIIVLVVICIGLFVTPLFLPDRSQQGVTDFTVLKDQIAAWEEGRRVPENEETTNKTSPTKPTAFDANTATEAQLQAVGLSSGSIRSWLSYTRKGGKFNKWEDLEKFRALSSAEKASIRPYARFENENSHSVDEKESSPVVLTTDFNPNEVDKQMLIAMGLSTKVATNWTRFLASGGRFRKPEDIQKIYGLNESDFQRLLPFAKIPDTPTSETDDGPFADASEMPQTYDAPARNVVIDINTSTVEDWQGLRGIGPAYSKRIINFRNKLGGFHSVQQVSETYGLPDSVFQKIQLQLRPSAIQRKLPVNAATVEELAAHPYLRFRDARMIVNYREEHGAYAGPEDLDKLYGLDEATKQKILPYLAY